MIYILSYGLTASGTYMHHLFYDTNNCGLCYAEHLQNSETVDIISIEGYLKNGEVNFTDNQELITPPIKFKIEHTDIVYYNFTENDLDIFTKLVSNKIEEIIFSGL